MNAKNLILRLFFYFMTTTSALGLMGCTGFLMGEKPEFQAKPALARGQPTSASFAPVPPVRNALHIVQEYYAEIGQRDIDAAVSHLAFDVVQVEIAPSGSQVVKGYDAIESELDHSNTLSFVAEDFQMQGNVVTYTLTEWLDPRVVGPDFKQPVRSRMRAVVKNGEIIIIHKQVMMEQ